MADYGAFNDIYVEVLGDHRPARSLVAVAGLPLGALVEVEVWAYVPGLTASRPRRRRPHSGRPGGRSGPGAVAEAVADGADRLDQVGVLLAELGPEAPDVDVDGAGAAVVLVAPDPAEQRLAGEDLAGSGGQEAQELVLHEGEVEDPARHRRLVGLQVEHERAVLDELGVGAPGRCARRGGPAGPRSPRAWPAGRRSRRSGPRAAAGRSICSGSMTSRRGRSGTSRVRTSRHRAKAPAASVSAQTTAPAQPSSGSSVWACSGRATAFQG